MTAIDPKRMTSITEAFSGKIIVVLGDLMLDRYIWGHVARISPEAPVPVVEVRKETLALGGAGNVGRNLESLDARPILVGVVGNDFEGDWIRSHVPDDRGLFRDENRPTVVKTRIIAHQQQVVRVDQEDRTPLSLKIRDGILRFLADESYDGLILSDYSKGLLGRSLIGKALTLAGSRDIPVMVDPKVDNFPYFSPVTLITPNHHEAEKIVHFPCDTDERVERAGEKILGKISARYLILKRGAQGMSVFEKGLPAFHIPTLAKEVYDVTGAGDTVIATAALGLLSGGSIREAAVLANLAAGVVVGKIGTASVTRPELLRAAGRDRSNDFPDAKK